MKTLGCKLYHKKVATSPAADAVTELICRKENPSILGGNSSQTDANRFSFWAFEPKEIFVFTAGQKDPFGKLEKLLNKYRLTSRPTGLPAGIFSCGWLGFFGYELGRYIEKIPETTTDDIALPIIRLCFYDKVICYDRIENIWRLIVLEIEGEKVAARDKLAGIEKILTEAENLRLKKPEEVDLGDIDMGLFGCNMSRKDYYKSLEKIRRYIYDGDVYQINFSQRFQYDYKGSPADLYHWQNEFNPSPYAAFIGTDDFAIVSASPEMFITIRNGVISTRPIKGTRRRLTNHPQGRQINEINFTELVQSQKEQAELNMIIDLERNDLARICKPGTRKVTQPRTIEKYPTVFHAVATIAGELKEPKKPSVLCDVLKATFPGGSITGAPKIRSMEIIDELEPTARSVYTGSIGFIGLDGNACLNIAIRTIIITDSRAYMQTGGGIVADSEADSEWDETITKVRAMFAGIIATQQKEETEIYGKSISK